MPDYQSGKIYAIRAPGTDDVYIGSTITSLATRMAQHRCRFKRRDTGKYSNTRSNQILEHEDAYIELIEEYPCNTKEQLRKREGEIIRSTAQAVNKAVAGRSRKETCDAYYESHKEQHSIYRASRKVQKAEYDKQRRATLKKSEIREDGDTSRL